MGIFTNDPLQIIVFQSYGTNNHLYIRGRALEDENINLDKNGFFGLLVNTWKRFESDEIKNTSLVITLPDKQTIETVTDNDGYFIVDTLHKNLQNLANEEGWVNFEISYKNIDKKRKVKNSNRFPGKLLIPKKTVEYGIISDIDDTILHTGVISKLKWKLLINTFFRSPAKRKALEGASTFYHLLHQGKTGKNSNPLFYVSHSPWNMYRYLQYFLEKNKFPKGAILLRTVKNIFFSKKDEKPQKQKEIINILKSYPKLSFVLIGDAGEYDAEIYMEVVKEFPKRVKCIFLRSVKSNAKIERINKLIKNYNEVPFFLIDSSKEGIDEARRLNLM